MDLNEIYPILTAFIVPIIIGVDSYIASTSKAKKDIVQLKEQNKFDIEKLINQHRMYLEAQDQKHKMDITKMEIEHKYKIELMQKEMENKIGSEFAIELST